MKFLLDQSADFRLIPYLEDLGHDVQVISRHYPHGLPDEEVLAIARRERRVLLVADRDFGQLIFEQHLAHAGVIFYRLPGAPLSVKIDRLRLVLANYLDQLKRAEFLVVTPGEDPRRRRPRSGVTCFPLLSFDNPSGLSLGRENSQVRTINSCTNQTARCSLSGAR